MHYALLTRGLVLFTLRPGGGITSPRELEHELSLLAADSSSDLYHGVYTRAVVAATGLLAFAADGTPRMAGDVAPSFDGGYPDGGHLVAYYNVSLDGATGNGTGTGTGTGMGTGTGTGTVLASTKDPRPQAVGGTAVTFSVFPVSLPAGLWFDNETGAFRGTPTVVQVTSTSALTYPSASAPPQPSPSLSPQP